MLAVETNGTTVSVFPKMFENSNLVITAWDAETLSMLSAQSQTGAGVAILLTWQYERSTKKFGIGRTLIEMTKEKGEESMVLLLSVPTAMEYYPKVGFHQTRKQLYH